MTPLWTFTAAAAWLRDRFAGLEQLGWTPTLVGSVPRNGVGHDLDIVFTPMPGATDLWQTIEQAEGWQLVESTVDDGLRRYVYVDAEGRHVHAQYAELVDPEP